MRIGVVGAGAIGCYVGGRIVAADAAEVVFVGRARVRDELAGGMTLEDLARPTVTVPAAKIHFETEMRALAGVDAVLCCVKSAQTREVAKEMAPILSPSASVLSLQNGVRNPEILREELRGRLVVPAIVSFNVVSRGGGVFRRATSGPLMLGPCDGAVRAALDASQLDVEQPRDLVSHQWTKLLVNLNNAVSALSGAPTPVLLATPLYRRTISALVGEAVKVLRAAGIKPARLQGVPIALMPPVLRLPTPIVKLVLRAQMKVDPEARSSMWEDLTRGRPTEVDYLNGEIVRVAERVGASAPLNARIVELVHAAERAGPGSPNMSAEILWTRLTRKD